VVTSPTLGSRFLVHSPRALSGVDVARELVEGDDVDFSTVDVEDGHLAPQVGRLREDSTARQVDVVPVVRVRLRVEHHHKTVTNKIVHLPRVVVPEVVSPALEAARHSHEGKLEAEGSEMPKMEKGVMVKSASLAFQRSCPSLIWTPIEEDMDVGS
jgi:hypothetical protein